MNYKVGDRLFIGRKYSGIIKYIGKIKGKEDEYVGVELDSANGNNDGMYNGIQYFSTEKNMGLFVKLNRLRETSQPLTEDKITELGRSREMGLSAEQVDYKSEYKKLLLEQDIKKSFYQSRLAKMAQIIEGMKRSVPMGIVDSLVSEVEILGDQLQLLKEDVGALRLSGCWISPFKFLL